MVMPVHFEDFSGHEFERLVFAFLLRDQKWRKIAWLGEGGGDDGRDIWGERVDGKSVCVQCANHQNLAAAKVIRDIDKLARAKSGLPHRFLAVSGHGVSANLRDKIVAYAMRSGITECEVWSGKEFEEHLRHRAESLLRRFVHGEEFPDDPAELERFASDAKPSDDVHAVKMIRRVFDRPAFNTPFVAESSLGNFRQALGDTIQALNTGVWRTRDGQDIERIPSRHDVEAAKLGDTLAQLVVDLTSLRTQFEQLLRSGDIQRCGCGDPDCPTFMVTPDAARQMDAARKAILRKVSQLAVDEPVIVAKRQQTITLADSVNHGVIANSVTIRGVAKPRPIVVPRSIGSDATRYNYVEYLIKQLDRFRSAGKSYGQRRSNRVNLGVTRKILERQLGGLPKDLPLSRFDEVVSHITKKINTTAQGRRNLARGDANFHSFHEHPGNQN